MGSTDDYRLHVVFHRNKILTLAPTGPGSPTEILVNDITHNLGNWYKWVRRAKAPCLSQINRQQYKV